MKNYHSFEFLKKIYFVRTAGSPNDIKAANLIKEEVENLGGKAWLEEFMVDSAKITKSTLKFSEPELEIECAGSGYSGYTDDLGVTGEFIVIMDKKALDMFNLKDKIVLLPGRKRAPHNFYTKALQDGAKAIILTTGNVYKDEDEVDLDPYLNRDIDYNLGYIPTIMVRMKDAERIMELMPKKATVVLQGEDSKVKTQNVVAEIKGTEFPDEIITFTAHHDSVSFSRGIYDNATGVITLLQMLNYYQENKPRRTLRFIWCGAEEMGLLGSKYHANTHEEEIKEKVLLNINIDMVAVTIGRDIAVVTGDESIVNYINFVSNEVGFPIDAKTGVYSSDSTPFADKGVPAISFARLAPQGGATIHSHDDVIERLSEPNYIDTCNFIALISSRFINAYKFPIKKEMPQKMLDELDYYLCRKERPEK